MRPENRNIANSKVYERLATIQMSRRERNKAVSALAISESVAAAILSAAHVLRLLFAVPHLKPSFKH
jgi:hypothetical protein